MVTWEDGKQIKISKMVRQKHFHILENVGMLQNKFMKQKTPPEGAFLGVGKWCKTAGEIEAIFFNPQIN